MVAEKLLTAVAQNKDADGDDGTLLFDSIAMQISAAKFSQSPFPNKSMKYSHFSKPVSRDTSAFAHGGSITVRIPHDAICHQLTP